MLLNCIHTTKCTIKAENALLVTVRQHTGSNAAFFWL